MRTFLKKILYNGDEPSSRIFFMLLILLLDFFIIIINLFLDYQLSDNLCSLLVSINTILLPVLGVAQVWQNKEIEKKEQGTQEDIKKDG